MFTDVYMRESLTSIASSSIMMAKYGGRFLILKTGMSSRASADGGFKEENNLDEVKMVAGIFPFGFCPERANLKNPLKSVSVNAFLICFTKVSSVKRGTWTKHPSLTFAWSNFSRSTLLDGNRVSSASEISLKMMMLADDALSPIDVLFRKPAFLSFFGLILDFTGA